MTEEQQLKLQAFLDNELPETEAREVAGLVARDREATDLLKELRHTRRALKESALNVKLPESREFYWSKIQREIERLEPEPAAAESAPFLARVRRFLVPAGAVAAAAILALVVGLPSLRTGAAPDTELAVADSGTFTYNDDANGTTLVWLSFPAER
jgi:negative regulator of sigma E activity